MFPAYGKSSNYVLQRRTLVNLTVQGCDLLKPSSSSLIMLFTAILLVVFSHILHKMITFREESCLCVCKLCGIQKIRTLPTKASYCLGARFVLDSLHITSCLRLRHKPPRKQNPKEFFNKFVQHYKKETFLGGGCWI